MNTPGVRPPQALTLTALAVALTALLTPPLASAQTDAAKPNAGLERAQKAADAVFHWIKLNGEKGANRQNPPPAPPPPPAPAPAARKAVAAAPRPAPTPAPQPAPAAIAAVAAPVPAPPPEPVVAVNAEPEPAPVLLAAAAPSPTPTAPLAAAARAVEPPPPPPEPAEVPLKLLVKVEPTIPRQLAQQNFRNGFAQVQFTVAPDGSVSRASVIKASHTRLGIAAVDAVKQWRFAPLPLARDAAVEVAFSNVDE